MSSLRPSTTKLWKVSCSHWLFPPSCGLLPCCCFMDTALTQAERRPGCWRDQRHVRPHHAWALMLLTASFLVSSLPWLPWSTDFSQELLLELLYGLLYFLWAVFHPLYSNSTHFPSANSTPVSSTTMHKRMQPTSSSSALNHAQDTM